MRRGPMVFTFFGGSAACSLSLENPMAEGNWCARVVELQALPESKLVSLQVEKILHTGTEYVETSVLQRSGECYS